VTAALSSTGDQFYDAIVVPGVLERLASTIAEVLSSRWCAIITDTNIAPIYGERVAANLSAGGFANALITIPPGEESKTLEQAGAVCDAMTGAGLDRQSFVIGVGGGVIGDISGFAAAIFHRGIPHIQIPTTLLAMVDSSIGGKTGVNTQHGKNLLGAVHHPVLVVDDVDVLRTLPEREYQQGLAEIIKHAVIADAGMFEDLQRDGAELSRVPGDENACWKLASLVRRNIEIKASIVAKDEMDRTGERAVLNFGHTIGHAIERAGEYRVFMHGEAVSLGMVAACTISMKRAGLPGEQRDAIVDLLQRCGLPVRLPDAFPVDRVLEALPFDKKFERGEVRFVVTPAIGSAYLASDVTMEDAREALNQL
jgi:3-dehydroquinate synthase